MHHMKSILLICALKEELEAVNLKFTQDFETILIDKCLPLTINKYITCNKIFYTCLSGMGPINASVRLSLILSSLKIDEVILLGVAGGLTTSTAVGDLVVASAVFQHDYYSSLSSGNYHMRSGELILNEADYSENYLIQTSEALKRLCLNTKVKGHQVYEGVMASGSEFVGTNQRKLSIAAIYNNTLAVDMEACAVANVCSLYRKPFAVAKTISDTIHSDGSIESDFLVFLQSSANNAASVVDSLIFE